MLFSQQNVLELLAPIQDDSVCGVYLKLDKSAFRPLRNEFNVAQTSLRKLSQNPSLEELETLQEQNLENWTQLSQSLMSQFKTVTRDIELVSWFLASQLILDHQFDGLANTLTWLADLIEQQWDTLNPVLPDNKLKSDSESGQMAEQAQAKVKAFFQLLGDSEESSLLYAPMLLQPLIGDVSFYAYQSAERKGDVNQLKQHAVSFVGHERAAINAKLHNLTRSLAQVERLSKLTFERCSHLSVNAPNFNFIKSLLTKFSYALQQLTGVKAEQKSAKPSLEANHETSSEPMANAPEEKVMQGGDQIESVGMQSTPVAMGSANLSQTAQVNSMNRDVAFHLLREVSDYFRHSEPHSPVSFLLEKAIRWGYLSLPELLQEMMAEQQGDQLTQIFNAAGLNHLDQVLLPDVDVIAADIKKPSTPTAPVSMPEPVSVEQQVSESSTADTQSKQQSEKPSSSGSTALRW